MSKYKKVLLVEDFFSTLHEIHENLLLHAGYHKAYDKVRVSLGRYHGNYLGNFCRFQEFTMGFQEVLYASMFHYVPHVYCVNLRLQSHLYDPSLLVHFCHDYR